MKTAGRSIFITLADLKYPSQCPYWRKIEIIYNTTVSALLVEVNKLQKFVNTSMFKKTTEKKPD